MENILIIIGGCSGAGKSTIGRLVAGTLEPSAWIDIDDLGRVNPWSYDADLLALGAENVIALAHNFWRAGYRYVVLSGGVPTQFVLDQLIAKVQFHGRIIYIWLDVNKTVRDRRRLARARDDADSIESFDLVDSVMRDPGALEVSRGEYIRITIADETPDEVLALVIGVIVKYIPEGKDD